MPGEKLSAAGQSGGLRGCAGGLGKQSSEQFSVSWRQEGPCRAQVWVEELEGGVPS